VLEPGDAPLTPEEPATPSATVAGRADASLQREVSQATLGAGQAAPFVYDRGVAAIVDATVGATRRTFFDTRPDWMTAVRREEARTLRYDRPVSVILLEIADEPPGPHLDAIAGDLAEVIRTDSRSTDRAVRYSARSFRILMPETGEESARVAAARFERTFASTASGRRGDRLGIEVATSSKACSLVDALVAAEERLGGTGPGRDLDPV
jgi:hypothetical protein